MKIKKIRHALWGLVELTTVLLFAFSSSGTVMTAKAANHDYVTITVDAVDDSGSLQYAIDSDAPEAFGDKSSFQVIPGSTHTIYVKDLAGNVTSQTYSIPEQEAKEPAQSEQDNAIQASASVNESYDSETDERKVNIDVNLSNGAYSTSGSSSAAEDGGGTLFDKVKTDGTDEAGKIFYTVTTKEGEVFYLVVDQNRSDNNVYLLTQATVNDLQYLADQNDYNFTVSATGQNSQSLLNLLSGPNGGQSAELPQQQPSGGELSSAKSEMNSTILVVVVVAIGGGGYYFFKTKKNRREKQMDEIDAANDLKDYEIEDDETEEDELEFDEVPAGEELPAEDEDLKELMKLNTEIVFGEEGEDEGALDAFVSSEQGNPINGKIGLEDYDEFGEEEEAE